MEFILLSVPVYSRSSTASNFFLGADAIGLDIPAVVSKPLHLYIFIQIKLIFRAILVDALICVPCRLMYVHFVFHTLPLSSQLLHSDYITGIASTFLKTLGAILLCITVYTFAILHLQYVGDCHIKFYAMLGRMCMVKYPRKCSIETLKHRRKKFSALVSV